MKQIRRTLCIMLSLLLIMGILPCYTLSAQAAAVNITVKKSAINAKDAYTVIQAALNTAKSKATASVPYNITVESGSYYVEHTLCIYSNTNLKLNGVSLVKPSGSTNNLLHLGDVCTDNKKGATGYSAVKNVTVTGGTLDGKNSTNTIFKAAHATNVSISGMTFKNTYGHFMEVAAISGLSIKNCSFKDQEIPGDLKTYEAIQVDILEKTHFNTYRLEDLPCKNVTVESCTFDNCPRGVGSHTSVNNAPHTNVTVNNCKFTNMKSVAIQFQGVENCRITNNTIDNTPRGIAVYSVLNNGSGCFKASVLAKEGNTTAHYSDSYQTPKDSKTVVTGNVIKRCGAYKDKYNKYDCVAICAGGYNVAENTSTLNKGDYYLKGVSIYDNQMEVQGHGIRLINVRDGKVDNNTITAKANTHTPANYYGISAVENTMTTSLTNNIVKSSPTNGLFIQNSKCDSVSCNAVLSADKYGIGLEYANVTNITGNTVQNTVNRGINLLGSIASNIKGNALSGISSNGISMDGSSNGGAISGNIITNCSGRDIYDGAGMSDIGENYDEDATGEISLSDDELIMKTGDKYTIGKTLSPPGSLATYIWTSSNYSVATVSGGVITAKKQGNANITVKTSNGKTTVCKVNVFNANNMPSIKLGSSCKLGKGESLSLNAAIVNPFGSAVTWSSSDPDTVSVSNGKITAVENGTATITASIKGAAASCTVTVLDAPEALAVSPQSLTLGVGETFTVTEATNSGSYANATNLKWTSSNTSVLQITSKSANKVNVKALKQGKSDLTISLFNGLKATVSVTVKAAPSSVKMNPSSLNLGAGESMTISESTNSGSYANAAGIKWSSSSSGIVSVQKGSGNKATVKGVKTGTATVTVTLYNGKKATCKVSVKPAPSSVSVNPSSFKLGKGEKLTISESTNKGSYANAANLSWTSSDSEIAAVSKGSGNKAAVTAVNTGSANISIRLYNGKSARSSVTVLPAPTSVKLSAGSINLAKGKTYTLSEITNAGSYANAANLKWATTNKNVATVTKGSGNKATVKAVNKGTAYISITLFNGLTAKCKVTVK